MKRIIALFIAGCVKPIILALGLVLAIAPAAEAISIDKATVASGTVNGSAAITVTAAQNVAQNSLVIIVNACSGCGGATTVSSVTDSVGNTYNCQARYPASGTPVLLYCWSYLSAPIVAASTTITVTWSLATGSKAMCGTSFTGSAASAAGMYGAGAPFSTSSSPTVTSPTIAVPPNQMVLGSVVWQLASGSVSAENNGYTLGCDVSLSNTIHLHSAYILVSAGGTTTYNPTLSTNETGAVNVAGYLDNAMVGTRKALTGAGQ